MHFLRECRSLFCAVPQAHGCQHITFGGSADPGPTSFACLGLYFYPQITFGAFYFLCLGVFADFIKYLVYLLDFEVNNIVHHALGLGNMLAKQGKIELSFRRKRIFYI